MDVVRKQIQKLRGHVEIQSRAGQGATFTLKVPLTLAIIDGFRRTKPFISYLNPVSPRRRGLPTSPAAEWEWMWCGSRSRSCGAMSRFNPALGRAGLNL